MVLYNFFHIDSSGIDLSQIYFIIHDMYESIALFLGFALGRFGDKYLGYLEWIWFIPVPHHWMWLLLPLAIFGGYWILKRKTPGSFLGYFLLLFCIGLFVSDLNDFLNMRFFGPEPPHIWRFWSIE